MAHILSANGSICRKTRTLPEQQNINPVQKDIQIRTQGPVLENNIYAGEIYDARLEIDGWNGSNFNDSSWSSAVNVSGPQGKLVLQEIPPIRKIEEIKPLKINLMETGRYVVDMGQNFSGWARIQLKTKSGIQKRAYPASA